MQRVKGVDSMIQIKKTTAKACDWMSNRAGKKAQEKEAQKNEGMEMPGGE